MLRTGRLRENGWGGGGERMRKEKVEVGMKWRCRRKNCDMILSGTEAILMGVLKNINGLFRMLKVDCINLL